MNCGGQCGARELPTDPGLGVGDRVSYLSILALDLVVLHACIIICLSNNELNQRSLNSLEDLLRIMGFGDTHLSLNPGLSVSDRVSYLSILALDLVVLHS